MIKNLKRLLICMCILLIIFYNFIGNISLAEETDYSESIQEQMQQEDSEEDDDGGVNIVKALGKVMSGLVGLITWIPRAMAVGGITAVQTIAASVAKMAGETNPDPDNPLITLTPDDILFNKITLTDINFFNTSGLDDDNPVYTIRMQIGLWYNVMRTIAIMISLIVLLIVGIRMAITTVASEKAIYKKALIDWLTSFVLIFFLHYLINIIIWCNNALVSILGTVNNSDTIKDVLHSFKQLLFSTDFIVGMGAIIIYVMLTIQTLMFLISYIKRMLTLAFLIIIAPLITITYPIDKMGDQKAQALNAWLKEFIYNVLIQPFHCILYLAFATTAIQTIASGGGANLAAVILAIICIHFVWTGEKIVNKIFGFGQASSLVTAAASGAVLGSMISKARNAGSNVKSGVKFASNSKTGQLLKQKMGANKGLHGLTRDGKKAYKEAKANGAKQEVLDKIKNDDKNKTAIKRAADNLGNKLGNTAPIKSMKAKAESVKTKTDNFKNKVSNNRVIKGIRDSEWTQALGADAKRFVRRVARPENVAKVGAAVMAGAAMYALPDSNLVSAVTAGYAAGKSAESGVRNLKERKKENFEENVLKAYDRHCQINNISPENRTKENFNDWYNNTYLKGENQDAYSVKNMGKEEDRVKEKLEAKGLGDDEISTIIAKIQRAMLSKEDYNPSEMFSGYDISPEEIAKIVQGYASKYNEQTVYKDASMYNQQMQPLGVTHEDAISGISDKAIRGNNETVNDYVEYVTDSGHFDEAVNQARGIHGDDANAKEIFRELETIVNGEMQRINQEVQNLASQLNSGLGSDSTSVMDNLKATVYSALATQGADMQAAIDSAISSMSSQLGAHEGTARNYATQFVEKVKIDKEKRFVELVEERKVINKQINKMINTP